MPSAMSAAPPETSVSAICSLVSAVSFSRGFALTASQLGVLLPYSRAHETEADEEGVRYAIEERTEPKLLVLNLREPDRR